MRDAIGRNVTGPTGEERNAVTAFEAGHFPFAERTGVACVVPIFEPGTIIGGEEDERAVIQAGALEGCEDFADGPNRFP